jgi:hypothetical protein
MFYGRAPTGETEQLIKEHWRHRDSNSGCGPIDLWALLRCPDFQQVFRSYHAFLFDYMCDPVTWKEPIAALCSTTDRKLHQQIVDLFKSTSTSIQEAFLLWWQFASVFLSSLTDLTDPTQAFAAGTIFRLFSRAIDSDAACVMHNFYESPTIVPFLLNNLAHPAVSHALADWLNSSRLELSMIIFYIFKSLFPSWMNFTGQADVRLIHRFEKFFELKWEVWSVECGSDKDWVAATRASAFQLIRTFFDSARTDDASFRAFVVCHLRFLPEASTLRGSRELFRLAKLLGADRELAKRALGFIREAESLANPDVVACFEYLPVCVAEVSQSEAECIVADCLRPQRATPPLALTAFSLFVAAVLKDHAKSAWDIGRFRNVVRKAAVACWNARPDRTFTTVCLDVLTVLEVDVPGVNLAIWRRANASEELLDLGGYIDFGARIEESDEDRDMAPTN